MTITVPIEWAFGVGGVIVGLFVLAPLGYLVLASFGHGSAPSRLTDNRAAGLRRSAKTLFFVGIGAVVTVIGSLLVDWLTHFGLDPTSAAIVGATITGPVLAGLHKGSTWVPATLGSPVVPPADNSATPVEAAPAAPVA